MVNFSLICFVVCFYLLLYLLQDGWGVLLWYSSVQNPRPSVLLSHMSRPQGAFCNWYEKNNIVKKIHRNMTQQIFFGLSSPPVHNKNLYHTYIRKYAIYIIRTPMKPPGLQRWILEDPHGPLNTPLDLMWLNCLTSHQRTNQTLFSTPWDPLDVSLTPLEPLEVPLALLDALETSPLPFWTP